MQIANILLCLGGDKGNTVPKYAVTVAEVAVLRLIHGDEAVTDIEPTGEIARSSREEIARLNEVYGGARIDDGAGNKTPVVGLLFPGAAARVYEGFDELDINEIFFKAVERVKPAPEQKKAAEQKTAKGRKSKEATVPAPETDEQDDAENDGITDMTDGAAFE